MKKLLKDNWFWLLPLVALVVAGCTAAEWARIADDAKTAAPDAVFDAVSNPNPVNWILVVSAFVTGLIGKSAARGFGRGATALVAKLKKE